MSSTRQLAAVLVALSLCVWVSVGLYSFYFLERGLAPPSPPPVVLTPEQQQKPKPRPPPPTRKRPYTYPLCRSITHLPTSLSDFDCGFNLMEDTHYLPSREMITQFRTGERKLYVERTIGYLDRQAYFARVWALQNPSDRECGDKDWHTVKFTTHGHGVNLFHLAVSIGNHYDRNLPVVASRSAYRFGSHDETCDGSSKLVNRGWSCHLSPLSQTCADEAADNNKLRGGGNKGRMRIVNWSRRSKPHAMADWCKPHGKYSAEHGRCKCDSGYLPNESGSSCLSFTTDETFADKRKWQHRYDRYHNNKHGDDGDDYAMQGTEHWVSRMAPGEIFATQNDRDPATWPYEQFVQGFPATGKADFTRVKLKYGFFWWILQNSWLLHKDAPKRAEMERQTRALLFSPHRAAGAQQQCVAVQVRRGDSCRDKTAPHRTCPKLQVYVDRVQELKRHYGLEHQPVTVYLASDDPSAIEEAKQLQLDQGKGVGGDVWVWQPISRQRYVNGKVVDDNPSLFKDEAMDELYYDLWAISQCELGFVTSFASSVAWNAYAMAVGRFGYYIPFISVDLPWGHKILGEHHARGNLFDGTVDSHELDQYRPALLQEY